MQLFLHNLNVFMKIITLLSKNEKLEKRSKKKKKDATKRAEIEWCLLAH